MPLSTGPPPDDARNRSDAGGTHQVALETRHAAPRVQLSVARRRECH